MTLTDTSYCDRVEAPGTFDEVLARTRAALIEEGFGVLCEIDVQANLKARLGVDREPYVILGPAMRRMLARRSRPSRSWALCFRATWSSSPTAALRT